MRELKFRAWDGEEMGYFTLNDIHAGGSYIYTERGNHFHADMEIMQYTGLKDKNGKEIYEGDVVRSDGNHPDVVIWEKDGWTTKNCWIIYQDEPGRAFSESEPWEVIGNIYENPELLENNQ